MARNVKNPGLNRHARALGVSPGHLAQVANQTRQSPELLARYRALVAADPDGARGARVTFLPPGTVFQNVTPSVAKTALQMFGVLRVRRESIPEPEGNEGHVFNLVLEEPFTMTFIGEQTIMNPAHPAAKK